MLTLGQKKDFIGLHIRNILKMQPGSISTISKASHWPDKQKDVEYGLRIEISPEYNLTFEHLELLSHLCGTRSINIRGDHWGGTDQTPGSTEVYIEVMGVSIEEVWKRCPENHRCGKEEYLMLDRIIRPSK